MKLKYRSQVTKKKSHCEFVVSLLFKHGHFENKEMPGLHGLCSWIVIAIRQLAFNKIFALDNKTVYLLDIYLSSSIN